MKKIICYWRTLKELDSFLTILFNTGAVWVDHDYYEVSDKYIKSRKRFEQKLKCRACGKTSVAWYGS